MHTVGKKHGPAMGHVGPGDVEHGSRFDAAPIRRHPGQPAVTVNRLEHDRSGRAPRSPPRFRSGADHDGRSAVEGHSHQLAVRKEAERSPVRRPERLLRALGAGDRFGVELAEIANEDPGDPCLIAPDERQPAAVGRDGRRGIERDARG